MKLKLQITNSKLQTNPKLYYSQAIFTSLSKAYKAVKAIMGKRQQGYKVQRAIRGIKAISLSSLEL